MRGRAWEIESCQVPGPRRWVSLDPHASVLERGSRVNHVQAA